jgi:dipeptidyl aminopeptidase/acylaminoacyl peptidase
MRRTLSAAIVVVMSMGTASAQKRPVTFDDVMQMKTVAAPAVSPDGREVLYTVRHWEPASEGEKDRMEARSHVWKVATDASSPARQFTYGERGETQPQWSPDGRTISFLAARGTGTGDDAPRAQIYVMRSDGGEARALTDAKEAVTGIRLVS